MISATNRSLFI